VERGSSLSADANDAGRYLIRFIEPGLYNISVEAAASNGSCAKAFVSTPRKKLGLDVAP